MGTDGIKYPELNEKANIREALYGIDYLNTISMYRIQLNIFSTT